MGRRRGKTPARKDADADAAKPAKPKGSTRRKPAPRGGAAVGAGAQQPLNVLSVCKAVLRDVIKDVQIEAKHLNQMRKIVYDGKHSLLSRLERMLRDEQLAEEKRRRATAKRQSGEGARRASIELGVAAGDIDEHEMGELVFGRGEVKWKETVGIADIGAGGDGRVRALLPAVSFGDFADHGPMALFELCEDNLIAGSVHGRRALAWIVGFVGDAAGDVDTYPDRFNRRFGELMKVWFSFYSQLLTACANVHGILGVGSITAFSRCCK